MQILDCAKYYPKQLQNRNMQSSIALTKQSAVVDVLVGSPGPLWAPVVFIDSPGVTAESFHCCPVLPKAALPKVSPPPWSLSNDRQCQVQRPSPLAPFRTSSKGHLSRSPTPCKRSPTHVSQTSASQSQPPWEACLGPRTKVAAVQRIRKKGAWCSGSLGERFDISRVRECPTTWTRTGLGRGAVQPWWGP